jgi:hypothetical protein
MKARHLEITSVEVFNARPHPGPLPRERGNVFPLSAKMIAADIFQKPVNRLKLSMSLPLLGERAGVRAVVRLTCSNITSPQLGLSLVVMSPK